MSSEQQLWESFKERVPEMKRQIVPTPGVDKPKLCHPDHRVLLQLPIVRQSVGWNPNFGGAINVDGYADNIAAVMLYLVGVAADEPCTKCSRGTGPIKGCIVPPPGSNVDRYCCANCRWAFQYAKCSFWKAPKTRRGRSQAGPADQVVRDGAEQGNAHEEDEEEEDDFVKFIDGVKVAWGPRDSAARVRGDMDMTWQSIATGDTNVPVANSDRIGTVHSGTVSVVMGGQTFDVGPTESIRIPSGWPCLLRNSEESAARIQVILVR